MNEHEIRQLYAAAMAYDNRKLSEANVTAWAEQARRNRWTFPEAVEAVHQHYGSSSEFLMPAHITSIIRDRRGQPERVHESRRIDATHPAQPERVEQVMSDLSRHMGWDRTAAQHHDDPARQVECPHCHAGSNRPCSRMVTRGAHRGEHVPLARPHPSRTALAAPVAEQREFA